MGHETPSQAPESEAVTIAYFGPEYTNTHLAARRMFGAHHRFVPQPSMAAVVRAVANSEARYGVVPIENSTEGVIRETLDSLLAQSPRIEREFEMEIRHCLMGLAGQESHQIQRIVSHPQPLAQCRKWLDQHYPNQVRESAASTAVAAKLAAQTPGVLAIGTSLAAESLGLEVYASQIADNDHNATRFVAVGHGETFPTGCDRTSLVLHTAHERGALLRLLQVFEQNEVNLTRIESRPLASKRWEYEFVIDIEGHQKDPGVHAALDQLASEGALSKVLGSYARFLLPEPQTELT